LIDDEPITLPPLGYRIVAPILAQAQNVAKLEAFHFVPTRFLDREDFERLGIMDELDRLIGGIGWQGIASIGEVAYREPTIEFLSSFSLIDDAEAGINYCIKYRL